MLTGRLTTLLLCCALLLCGGMAAQALQRGLLFYTPFDGNTVSLVDWVKPVNHGVSLVADKFGRANRAILFDEPRDHLAYGTIPQPRGTHFSISCWIRPDQANEKSWSPGLTGMTALSQIFSVLPSALVIDLDLPTLETDTWQHLVVVGEDDQLQYCLNGACTTFKLSAGEFEYRSDHSFTLGGKPDAAFPFYGALDEIRVYNRKLNDREIEMLYREFRAYGQPGDFSVKSVATPTLSVFPNPTSSVLKVEFAKAASRSLEITDATGRNMSYGRYTEAALRINVSGFPPGTYYLRIKEETGITVHQFIKQGVVLP